MNKVSVIVVGDIMLDQYHFWRVERLNPESPNPLLTIQTTENRLWWAWNVAANLAAMGNKTLLIGQLWNDTNWSLIQHLCKQYDIQTHIFHTPQPTITKTRFVETTYNQQLLRADFEEKIYLSPQQEESIIATIQQTNAEYIIVADYNKWVISDTLIEQLNRLPHKILLDTKSYKIEQFTNIFLLKPNFKELQEIIWYLIENTDEDIESHGIALAKKLWCNIVITRWKEWASLITPDGTYLHLQTQAKTIFDVSGAGDTFSAGVITGLIQWMNLPDAVMLGNKASGIAVSKIGTSIVTWKELFDS
jgi:rfaE bifunctional protein kinase chain/domain